MLREPKTLPGSATVEDVRAQLSNPKVQLVLLADGGKFVGAVSALPSDAAADEEARGYVERDPDTVAPTEPAAAAFARTANSPHRRIVVVDESGNLVGLLCLDPSRTRFCRTPSSSG